MTGIKLFECLTFLVVLVTLNVTHGQLESITKTQIRLGLKDAQAALDYGKELMENIKPLANVLGVFGAFATFAMLFVPSQESAEMLYMKEQFGQINLKLDRISNQIDSVKALVNYDTQKTAYVNSANKITFGFKQLQKFQNEIAAPSNCSTQQSCKRERLLIADRYVDSFNVKEALYKIMIGTSDPGTVFGEALLELINKYYQCDIGIVRGFADGVISLAYKGQYVVLAHEKLTGSNKTIATAMKDWSAMAYDIRKKADDIQSNCYSNISHYIDIDVKDNKYQTAYDGNKEAAVALKKFLDTKYPWIVWTVLSYGAYGGKNHFGHSAFINMPSEGRKRVLRVIASDNGTYSSASSIISKLNITIHDNISYYDSFNAQLMYSKIEKEVGTSTYSKILSLVMLVSYSDLEYVEDGYLPKMFKRFRRSDVTDSRYFTTWAMVQSDEQIAGVHCGRFCKNSGTCKLIPFTSRSYCMCENFFYGENCEHYDTVSLAANIDSMLTVTFQIPTIPSLYFKLEDSQQYIAASFNNVQVSIAQLNQMLQKKLTTGFHWTNLLTKYGTSINELTYYLKRFESLDPLDGTYNLQSNMLANAILQPNAIEKWLYDLNFLITGRQHFFLSHVPLIFELMRKNRIQACSTNYKNIIDATWQQLMSLQTAAYIMWARSLSIQHKSSDDITLEQKQKVLNQTSFLEKATCKLTILNSVNVNCSGGYYIYPGMTIENKCNVNYFLVGNATVTCNKSSTCKACNCDPKGSAGLECDDQTGKCNCNNKFHGDKCNRECGCDSDGSYSDTCNQQTGKCKCIKPFYGDKCDKSDCVWSNWSDWKCDYCSGTSKRSRIKQVQQHGGGKHCTGNKTQRKQCERSKPICAMKVGTLAANIIFALNTAFS